MTLLNVPQCALCLSPAVGVQKSLLEDLCISTCLGSLSNLRLACIRTDDQVLTPLLLCDLLPELRLDLLVVVDGLAYPTVQSLHLCPVALARSIWLTLDTLDAIGQSTVSTHNVCAEAIDFLVRGAGAGNKVALQALQVVQTSLEIIDGASDSATVIENGVWIARLRCGRIWSSVAGEGLHFDIVCLSWAMLVPFLDVESAKVICTHRMMEAARRSCHRGCHMDWTGHTRRCCSCCTVGKPCQLLVYHLPVPMLLLIQHMSRPQ